MACGCKRGPRSALNRRVLPLNNNVGNTKKSTNSTPSSKATFQTLSISPKSNPSIQTSKTVVKTDRSRINQLRRDAIKRALNK